MSSLPSIASAQPNAANGINIIITQPQIGLPGLSASALPANSAPAVALPGNPNAAAPSSVGSDDPAANPSASSSSSSSSSSATVSATTSPSVTQAGSPQQHLLTLYQGVEDRFEKAQQARQSYVDARQQYLQAAQDYQDFSNTLNDQAYTQYVMSALPASATLAPTLSSNQPQAFPPGNYFAPGLGAPPPIMSSASTSQQPGLPLTAAMAAPPIADPYANRTADSLQLTGTPYPPELANTLTPALPTDPNVAAQQLASTLQASQPPGSPPPSVQDMLSNPQVMQQAMQMAQQLSPQDVQRLMQDPQVALQVQQLAQQLDPQTAQAMMSTLTSPNLGNPATVPPTGPATPSPGMPAGF